MQSHSIEIIPHKLQLTLALILDLLNLPETALSHGEDFTVTPSTRLHVNDDYILKGCRTLNFSTEKLAYAWASKQFEKEQAFKLYHPSKTWFIEKTEEGWTVGNVSPRLRPLHVVFKRSECTTALKLHYLSLLTGLYLSHGSKYQERLDEGLSNFGLDESNALYYLDDDFYQWDHLLSFANMVALWVRLFSATWLDNTASYSLGQSIKQQIEHYFSQHAGIDYASAFPEHLKQQFFNAISRERVQNICTAMSGQNTEIIPRTINIVCTKQIPLSSDHISSWFIGGEPVALISDIHANLPAFETVLEDIKQQGIRHIVCLGDIVGYGPHPSACIKLLQDLDIFVVRGNHDHMVGSGKDFSHGSRSSLHVAKWTIQTISQAERNWLKQLPLQFRDRRTMLVHGAPRDATFFNAYVYERTAEANLKWMEENGIHLCFHGHSHLQGFYSLQAGYISHEIKGGAHKLKVDSINLICPGAVGQPRSGNPGAEYAIYDPRKQEITFKRLDYDIQAVTKDMAIHKFPDQLITRLEEGF